MCTVLDERETKGLQQGAVGLIKVLRELDKSDDFIEAKLINELGLEKEKAKELLKIK